MGGGHGIGGTVWGGTVLGARYLDTVLGDTVLGDTVLGARYWGRGIGFHSIYRKHGGNTGGTVFAGFTVFF